MEYTNLGNTGLRVSRLCLGTMVFGTRSPKAAAGRCLDRALDLGMRCVETADVYGNDKSEATYCGLTEEIIGEWFQSRQSRERVILATKVYNEMFDDKYGPNSRPGLSAYKIKRQLKDSLRRLQTDYIDLYQLHHNVPQVNWTELMNALEDIVHSGQVIYVGSCNFGGRHLERARAEADKQHFLGLVSEQHKYNLLCRLPELEVLPAIEELGLGFMVWSPLEGGLLAENILHPTEQVGKRAERSQLLTQDQRRQLQLFEELCQEIGESQSTVALAWLLHQPLVTCPIIGPRTVEQLDNAVRALEISLSDEILQRLDEIFPPVGAGPDSYSW